MYFENSLDDCICSQLIVFILFFIFLMMIWVFFCHQTTQTTVMNSNLNPEWNEELMLSVPQDHGPVKLVSLFSILSHIHFHNDENNFFYLLNFHIEESV